MCAQPKGGINLAYLGTACGSPAYAAPVNKEECSNFLYSSCWIILGNYCWNKLSRRRGKERFLFLTEVHWKVTLNNNQRIKFIFSGLFSIEVKVILIDVVSFLYTLNLCLTAFGIVLLARITLLSEYFRKYTNFA